MVVLTRVLSLGIYSVGCSPWVCVHRNALLWDVVTGMLAMGMSSMGCCPWGHAHWDAHHEDELNGTFSWECTQWDALLGDMLSRMLFLVLNAVECSPWGHTYGPPSCPCPAGHPTSRVHRSRLGWCSGLEHGPLLPRESEVGSYLTALLGSATISAGSAPLPFILQGVPGFAPYGDYAPRIVLGPWPH